MLDKLTSNVSKVIVGRESTVKLLLTAMISGGHVLIEDLPGSGKTKLAKAISKSMDLNFSRIQFTPDLLPTDITGLNVYNRSTGEFELKKGPVFTNILLADEINRATPRTQAGILECMEEHQVTIDGKTYKLDQPFFVIATQNPVETSGTFPLPEAQMDRFIMKLSMGYPTYEEEIDIVNMYMKEDPLNDLSPVLTLDEFTKLKNDAVNVFVSDGVKDYIVNIVRETRNNPKVLAGVSARGTLALLNASKAYAMLSSRNYVIPDDVSALSTYVLAHRLVLANKSVNSKEAVNVIENIVSGIKKPTENFKEQ